MKGLMARERVVRSREDDEYFTRWREIMKSSYKKQQGFTLIELMIVVAIIGILAAIALPAYQDYTNKSKFTEVVVATSAVKTAFEVAYATDGVIASAAANTGVSSAVSDANGQGGYVGSVAINSTNGTITATSQSISTSNETYILVPSAVSNSIQWDDSTSSCKTAGWC